MTWIELTPELIANLESYSNVMVVKEWIWVIVSIAICIFMLIFLWITLYKEYLE